MNGHRIPPDDRPMTPTRQHPGNAVEDVQLPTPSSLKWDSPESDTAVRDIHFSALRTQEDVDACPAVKRFQQDLLILTSFNDNSSLHWRPSWFKEDCKKGTVWTLHNPPDVVTEPLSNDCQGPRLYTRRMRRVDDPAPLYIKDWEHWARYCNIYGVPRDFLCEDQVQLMRMGLPIAADDSTCAPPQYPLYPEPPSRGRYTLTPSVYSTHLPRRFQHVVAKRGSRRRRSKGARSLDDEQCYSECVVVEPDGRLTVRMQKDCALYSGSSKGYRWSYLPWTAEMQRSCRPLTLKVRLWNEHGGSEGRGEGGYFKRT